MNLTRSLLTALVVTCLMATIGPAHAQTIVVRPTPAPPPTVTVCTPHGCVVVVRRPWFFYPRPVVVVQPQAAPQATPQSAPAAATQKLSAAPQRFVRPDGTEYVVLPDGGTFELTRAIKDILEAPQPSGRERKDFSGGLTSMIVHPAPATIPPAK